MNASIACRFRRNTHGRTALEHRGALGFQAKQCHNCHLLGEQGGKRGRALDRVALHLTEDQLIRQVIQCEGIAYGKKSKSGGNHRAGGIPEDFASCQSDAGARRLPYGRAREPVNARTNTALVPSSPSHAEADAGGPALLARAAATWDSAAARCCVPVRPAHFVDCHGVTLVALDHRMLSLHMVKHLLLMAVAPPLLLLGLHAQVCGRCSSSSVFCWLAATAVIGCHVPAVFQVALRSQAWHHVEPASFLLAGLIFWWPVLHPSLKPPLFAP